MSDTFFCSSFYIILIVGKRLGNGFFHPSVSQKNGGCFRFPRIAWSTWLTLWPYIIHLFFYYFLASLVLNNQGKCYFIDLCDFDFMILFLFFIFFLRQKEKLLFVILFVYPAIFQRGNINARQFKNSVGISLCCKGEKEII